MDTTSGNAKGSADAADPREQLSKAFDAFSGAAARFIDANQRYLRDLQEHSREAGARILAAKSMQEACTLELSEFMARCTEFQRYSSEVGALLAQSWIEAGGVLPMPIRMPASFNGTQGPSAHGANGLPDMNAIARSMFDLAGNGLRQMTEMSGQFLKTVQAGLPARR
ncbi:MAG TPA: hypothetical protein VF798_00370 [Burkholderiaceae bacterium]